MKSKVMDAGIELFLVAPGVWGLKDIFVNLYVINNPSENNWWLVDTGVLWSGSKVKRMAGMLFGAGSKPAAIILTHGHFDHIGSVKRLSKEWNIPVYAHHLEIPYLTGVSSYPPADPTVGGGLMADLSFLFPKGPIDIGESLVALPQGGTIPGLPDWQYFHTPGHAPGHISLFRKSDKVLIAGDAFVTTKSESALYTIFQFTKLSGPPKYFTSDWLSAASSVALLADLEPETVATGHGRPMRGAGMRKSLHNLALNFEKTAIPAKGRYIHQPALMDDSGVVHIPPKNRNASTAPTLKLLAITAAVLITFLLLKKSKKKRKKRKALARLENNNAPKIKYLTANEAKSTRAGIKDTFAHLKDTIKEKSQRAGTRIKDEIEKIKSPVLEILDSLKFKVK
ncbi:MAG: MBL fold metallo-hydrolase [Bacteroidota bacterium]